jgi:hypothetical protein
VKKLGDSQLSLKVQNSYTKDGYLQIHFFDDEQVVRVNMEGDANNRFAILDSQVSMPENYPVSPFYHIHSALENPEIILPGMLSARAQPMLAKLGGVYNPALYDPL